MNEKLRTIHLYSAFSLFGFMLLYFVSGFVVLNRNHIPGGEPTTNTRTVQVQPPDGLDAGQTGRWLASQLGLGGQAQEARVQADGRVRYAFNRPGTGLSAELSADRRSVEITSTRWGLRDTLGGYHFVSRYGGGWLWNLWALLLDLTSLGCIVFAVSGVCIWATARERDRGSWMMLALGLLVSVGSVLYLMLTK